MNILRIGAILVCFAIVVPSVQAQSEPKDAAEQKDVSSTAQPVSYQDTADGLHALLQQIVSALQSNDGSQVHTLTHNMILPGYQTWFPQVFGPELGAHIARFYEDALPDFDAILADAISRFVDAGPVEITVSRSQPSELPEKETYAVKVIKTMQNPVPIYTIGINKPGEAAGSVPGLFVFVQGGFRYVGWHAMRAVPQLVPRRIRVGGNVQAAKRTHEVMPVYPREAEAKRIQGTVVVHAVVDYDGSMLEVQSILGPPELMKAAADAVRQWRYKPTLLDGKPVQVDTTISVTFALGKN